MAVATAESDEKGEQLFIAALVVAVPAWWLLGVFGFVLGGQVVWGIRVLLAIGVCALGWDVIGKSNEEPSAAEVDRNALLPPPPSGVHGLSEPPAPTAQHMLASDPTNEIPVSQPPTAARVAGLTALGLGVGAAVVAVVIAVLISILVGALLLYVFWDSLN